MSRLVSLTLRRSINAEVTGEVPVVLVVLTHPNLSTPIYLSSDPTTRISTEPLIYGTVVGGNQYLFVLMSAIIPDDEEGSPPRTSLVFENVHSDMVASVRSIISPVSIDMSMVLSSTLDQVELEYTDLKGVKSSFDSDRVTMEISREPFTAEPCPAYRMTPARFAGLHR